MSRNGLRSGPASVGVPHGWDSENLGNLSFENVLSHAGPAEDMLCNARVV